MANNFLKYLTAAALVAGLAVSNGAAQTVRRNSLTITAGASALNGDLRVSQIQGRAIESTLVVPNNPVVNLDFRVENVSPQNKDAILFTYILDSSSNVVGIGEPDSFWYGDGAYYERDFRPAYNLSSTFDLSGYPGEELILHYTLIDGLGYEQTQSGEIVNRESEFIIHEQYWPLALVLKNSNSNGREGVERGIVAMINQLESEYNVSQQGSVRVRVLGE